MPKSDKDTLRRVHHTRSAVAAFFQQKWDSAKENAKFYRLTQYTDAQLQKFTSDKRVPYVLDYVSNSINTFLGVQRDQRTDICYLPFEKDDEMKVEVLNSVKDSTMNSNGFIYTESEMFQDGIIEKAGFVGFEWSKEKNPLGELKIFRIPQRQMSWDINRREYNLEKSTWVSRMRLKPKREMMLKFSDHAKEISAMQLTVSVLDNLGLDETYLKQMLYSDLDSLAYIEFYERDYENKYFLVDEDGNVSDKYWSSKKDAEKEIKNRLNQFEAQSSQMMLVAPSMTVPPKPPQFKINTEKLPIVLKSEVLHGMVLTDTEEIDEPFFPYESYHPFWHDGEWWSIMDLIKDPQRFINKTFLMVDHQMTTGAKGLLLIDENIPEPQANELIKVFSTTGGAMRIKDPKNNVQFIPPTGFDPRLLTAMDAAIVNLEKKAGGANFLGQRETASESGIAVRQRIEQGSLGSFVIYDNLSRTKKAIGEKMMWYLSNYMTAAQKIRLEGKELTDAAKQMFPEWFEPSMRETRGYLTINTEGNNTLEGLKADVVVDEAKHSVTKNQAILAQLSQAMQSSPLLAETIPPQMLIELMDIPATEKQKWLQQADQLLQAKMQKDQAMAQKPPAISATLADVEKLDPQTQAQFMAKYFQIQMNQPMQSDSPHDEKIMQAMIDMQKIDKQSQADHAKHKDQMAVKLTQLAGEHDLEMERMKNDLAKTAIQAKNKGNGNAVQK